MKKNLIAKTVLIVAVLLVFLYGMIGIPKSWNRGGILASMQQRIKLGLDLKGGTHLILQVVVNDAVRAESERVVERLKDDLTRAKAGYADITIPQPAEEPQRIEIRGVAPESSGELRRIVAENLPEWDLVSGAENNWALTLKNQALVTLKDNAVSQAIETI
ncbi:MAG: protein translocase subunit SecD, partial [Acidobacteria bacterium]|nr:protein translocase subunit SecD [Acidobacteriota bacterium]